MKTICLVAFIIWAIAMSAFVGCTPPSPSPTPSIGCYDSSPAPSVRWGSLDLSPTVGIVPAGGVAHKTLHLNTSSSPPTISIDLPGTAPQSVFEICVKTSPPAVNTHLGVQVAGTLTNPAASQPWQQIFGSLFVDPLQDTQSNAAGIVKVDVSASQIYSALQNAPTNQGTERIQFLLNPTYELELTLVKP